MSIRIHTKRWPTLTHTDRLMMGSRRAWRLVISLGESDEP